MRIWCMKGVFLMKIPDFLEKYGVKACPTTKPLKLIRITGKEFDFYVSDIEELDKFVESTIKKINKCSI